MTHAPPAPVPFDVHALRQEFPLLQQTLPNGAPIVYLDTASSAQKFRCVLDRMRDICETTYANAYRGVYRLGAQIDDALEASRATVARFLGAREPDEIVFTSGTTMSINLVAYGWGRKFLRPGDEILVNLLEHHANRVPWQQAAEKTGAVLRDIPLTTDGRLDLDRLDEVLSPRTKLLAVTGMSNVLGTIPPLAELVRRAKQVGAAVLVDGAQSVPHAPTDVLAPEIDFLACSGHKLYGPTGIGILYGRRERLEEMDPFLTGGHMISEVFRDRSTWAGIPAKFEAGTLPLVEAIALGTAIDRLAQIGFDAIGRHEHLLLEAAHRRLAEVPGLRILGPSPGHKGAIASFVVDGAHPQDLAVMLDRRGVCVRHGHHCTMPLHAEHLHLSATVRASFGLYNTLEEVDSLVEALHFARKKLHLT